MILGIVFFEVNFVGRRRPIAFRKLYSRFIMKLTSFAQKNRVGRLAIGRHPDHGRKWRADSPLSPVGIVFSFVAVSEMERLVGVLRGTGSHLAHLAGKAGTVRYLLDQIFPLGHGNTAKGAPEKHLAIVTLDRALDLARERTGVVQLGIDLESFRGL